MKKIKMAVMLWFWLTSMSWAEEDSTSALMIDPDCIDSRQICQERADQKEALRQRCLADPVWCEERRTKLRQQRDEKQALKEQCQTNPEQCEELKRQFKEQKIQQRKEQRKELKEAQAQWCTENPSLCQQWKADKKEVNKQCSELKRLLQEKYPDMPH